MILLKKESYNVIAFYYTTKKGEIVETFNFSNNEQVITSPVKTTNYQHDGAHVLAFYMTELLRELRKRDIEYVQKTSLV